MEGRPDASAYPVAGVRHARRVAPISAGRGHRDGRNRPVDRHDAPTGNSLNRSADVGVDPGTISHSHLAVVERQDHAARARIAALKTGITDPPRSPAERSGN